MFLVIMGHDFFIGDCVEWSGWVGIITDIDENNHWANVNYHGRGSITCHMSMFKKISEEDYIFMCLAGGRNDD